MSFLITSQRRPEWATGRRGVRFTHNTSSRPTAESVHRDPFYAHPEEGVGSDSHDLHVEVAKTCQITSTIKLGDMIGATKQLHTLNAEIV